MVASTVAGEKAGNEQYQKGHMGLIFEEGLSFSGFERNHLFLNQAGRRFVDISGVSGLDSIADSRSAVLADLDNDGDLDLFVTTIQGEAHLLFRNNVGQENRFLRVELAGRASGRDAFGARVEVKTSQGILTRVKSGGEGFLAQHDPRLLFGLGQDAAAEWVRVTWPSGASARIGPVAAGSSIRVVEGGESFQRVREPAGKLPDPLTREERSWTGLALTPKGRFPALKLRSVSGGGQLALGEGQSYFINFWATWCGPCRKEMPELQKLKARFRGKGIQLVGVSLDFDLEAEAVEAFARGLGVDYPLYIAAEEDLAKIWPDGRAAVPLSVYVDGRGRARQAMVGWNPENEKRIHRLLEP